MAQTFQVLIDDTSPSLSYFPFADTFATPDLTAGWNPYYTNSGFPSSPGAQGNGTSLHLTSHDGAVFSFNWTGSGVQIFGNTSTTYDLLLDGQITNTSVSAFSTLDSTLLCAFQNLSNEFHTLSLLVHNPTNSTSALIGIDRAVIFIPISQSSNVTTTIVQDTSIAFVGEWSFEEDATLTQDDDTFHTTSNRGDQAFFNFSGSAVSVSGFRDISSGNYTIQLDHETFTFDGESSWKEATQLFFQTGLDPTTSHQLTITNVDNRLLAVGSINVTSVSGASAMSSSPSHGLSGGTIAAIVIATVLGFLVVCALLYLFLRRRRSIQRRRTRSPTHPSSVLDIGPRAFEDAEHEPKDKSPAHGSVSFTLELPISHRPQTNSQRAYSEDLVQPIPRSPTVSLKRSQGTHARDSSLGALMADVPTAQLLPQVVPHSPFQLDLNVEPRNTDNVRNSAVSPRNSLASPPPVAPLPPIPTVNVISSSPPAQTQLTADEGDTSDTIFSFLDISSSGSPSVHQSPAQRSSSLSSSSVSARQNRASQSSSIYASNRPISYAPDRPISLGFAFDYHRSVPAPLPTIPAAPTPVASPVALTNTIISPAPVLAIRPLPRIPAPAAEEETTAPLPSTAPLPVAEQNPPTLRLQTEQIRPRMRPRSMSASGASTSAIPSSSGNGTSNAPQNILLRNLAHLHPPSANIGSSPTDSIPATVSDIHFRQEDSEMDSDEVEPSPEGIRPISGSHRPPHPPLPQRTYASPFIVQKLLGDQVTLGRSPGQASAATAVSSGSSTVLPDTAGLRRLPPILAPSAARGHERGQSLPVLSSVTFSPGLGREPRSAREQPPGRSRVQAQEEEEEDADSPQLTFAPGLGPPPPRR